jgi:hypothetical protein
MVVEIGGSDFENYIDDGKKGVAHTHMQQKIKLYSDNWQCEYKHKNVKASIMK